MFLFVAVAIIREALSCQAWELTGCGLEVLLQEVGDFVMKHFHRHDESVKGAVDS